MAVAGREPDPNAVNRNVSTVEYTDVPDRPYTGRRPTLARTRKIVLDDEVIDKPLDKLTLGWWEVVSKMPHAALWTPADWLLAQSTAILFDVYVGGTHTVAAELRRREQELGTTVEARRKLRIRYTTVEKPTPKPRASRAKTTQAAPAAVDPRRQNTATN